MDESWTRTTLAGLDPAGLAGAFTTVYTDYVIPMQMSPEQVVRHVGGNDIVLDRSPLWLDERGGVVAMAALGVRGDRGWIGGFGIAPPFRERGLGHALLDDVLATADRLGLAEVWLEVLVDNSRAIRVYDRAGFRTVRDLRVLRRSADTSPASEESADVVPADPLALLADRPLDGPTRPAWQLEPATLRRVDGLAALGLVADPRAGFVVYRPLPASVQVLDLFAEDTPTAAGLLAALGAACAGLPLSRTNEPADGPASPAFGRLGWVDVLRQHEMRFDMRKPDG